MTLNQDYFEGDTLPGPGFYSMSAADYFDDPCPSPSLTQSLAKVLIDRSPLHAWTQHPRLNPHYTPNDDTKFDIGNVAHLIVLGRGKEVEIVEAADWRTKGAKEARATAAQAGRLAVLEHQFKRADDMAAQLAFQLPAGCENAFRAIGGQSEIVLAWRDGDIWLRTMIDRLSSDFRIIWDYKTTDASAAPHALPYRMVDGGWDVQAAMHELGLNALDPENSGRRAHRFVVQETAEPYAVSVIELPESVMTMGRKKLAVAREMWRQCMASGTWPGYPAEVHSPAYPGFKEAQWLEREMTEFSSVAHCTTQIPSEFQPNQTKFDPDLLMGG